MVVVRLHEHEHECVVSVFDLVHLCASLTCAPVKPYLHMKASTQPNKQVRTIEVPCSSADPCQKLVALSLN